MASASALRRARYRVGQFTRGLRPTLTPAEVEAVRAYLSPAERALFLAADARDRRHSVDLFEALRAAGATEPELVAALVHDVGKGPLRTWHRVAFVLLAAAAPRLERALEADGGADGRGGSDGGGGAGWRGALWRLRHHARLGAALLEAAGSAPRVVQLVAGHTGAPRADDPALERFIRLDDRL